MAPMHIDGSQRRAANVIGLAYLLAMATGVFAEEFVRGQLIDYDNATVTAQNIISNKTLFRVGILAEIFTYLADLALIAALYVVLAPINRHLALFATLVRVVAESIHIVMAAGSFEVLRVLGNGNYLEAFGADQLHALARLNLGAHGTLYNVGFVVLGVGSTVFGYLWLKSGYVPRAWGHLGIVGSLLLSAGTVLILLIPNLQGTMYPWYMIPLFIFEVGFPIWLFVVGLRPSVVAEGPRPAQ